MKSAIASRRAVVLAIALGFISTGAGVAYGLAQMPRQTDDQLRQEILIRDIVTHNDRLGDAGTDVAGFGGIDWEDGVAYVYMMDPSQQQAAEQIARTLAGDRPVGEVRTRQADYTMEQLVSWYQPMVDAIFGAIDEVTLTDITEQKNRLTVGISDERARSAVLTILQELGIPTKAVILEVIPRAEFFGTDNDARHWGVQG